MRHGRLTQLSPFHPGAVDHPLGEELQRMAGCRDERPERLDWVAADLGGRPDGVGRAGLACETVLGCAMPKHLRQENVPGSGVPSRGLPLGAAVPAGGRAASAGKPALQATLGSARGADVGADQPPAAGVGAGVGVETGGADSGGRHGDAQPHPGAVGPPAAVRQGSGPDAPAGPGVRGAGFGDGAVPRPPSGGEAPGAGGRLAAGGRCVGRRRTAAF